MSSTLPEIAAEQKHHAWRMDRMEEAIVKAADTVNKLADTMNYHISSQGIINAETKIKIALAAGITSTIVSTAIVVGVKLWIK